VAGWPTIRTALATSLRAGITLPAGVEVYDKIRANPSLPCVWVAGLNEVEYHVAMRGGGTRWQALIQGITQAELLDETAQEYLDLWLSDEDGGVMAAVEADDTLGDVCEDLIVRESSGYSFFKLEDVGLRLGADWIVDVYT
jgi:hypothetical protein